ncbi:MAG TPA: ribosome small subunit-dependent GTPase A [Vicinamibacteria bacterium]|nr:ribosome small subunit-dependent GTPase A [Vicinamibacteria bacterium]
MSLENYGWDESYARDFAALGEPGLEPARVVMAAGGAYRLARAAGEASATLSGRFRHRIAASDGYPTVGDWVAIDEASLRIEGLLPRRTKLSRKASGRKTEEQVVAANVDVVFAAMGLDTNFSPRRLERFLTTVWESGASPVVLLTKLDLCADVEARQREIADVTVGVEVILSSAVDGRGIDQMRGRLLPAKTSVLVGSSGVGKSTIINRLLGRAAQKTRDVIDDDAKGRHTTSHRELFVLPGGALLIDNPGVREIQLFGAEDSLEQTFADVASLSARCRFSDCTHRSEPSCAVLEAVAEGALSEERLESYRALERELQYLRTRQDQSAQRAQKQKWRAIHREMRRSGRHRRT